MAAGLSSNIFKTPEVYYAGLCGETRSISLYTNLCEAFSPFLEQESHSSENYYAGFEKRSMVRAYGQPAEKYYDSLVSKVNALAREGSKDNAACEALLNQEMDQAIF